MVYTVYTVYLCLKPQNMTQQLPPTITKIEVENFELVQSCTTGLRVFAQTFEIAYGRVFSDGSTDKDCLEIKAPYCDVENFFEFMAYGCEHQDLEDYLNVSGFGEQLSFFADYVKNHLDCQHINKMKTELFAAIESIGSPAA